MQTTDFSVTDSQTNATATATQAAVAGRRHHITHVVASLSAAGTALLQVLLGTTVVLERYITVNTPADLLFTLPVRGNVNELVSATLAAGGVGVVGKVTLQGRTE